MINTLTKKTMLVTLTFMLCIGASGLWTFTNIYHNRVFVRQLTDATVARLHRDGAFFTSLYSTLSEATAFATTHNAVDRQAMEASLAEVETHLQALAQWESTNAGNTVVDGSASKQLYDKRSALVAATRSIVIALPAASEVGDEAAIQQLRTQIQVLEEDTARLDQAADGLLGHQIDRSTGDVLASGRYSMLGAAIGYSLFMLLLVLIIAGLRRYIVRPTLHLSRIADAVAAGERPLVQVTDSSEIGQLQSAFNHMIDQIKNQGDALVHQASHDSLTALPNRTLFIDRLNAALDRSRHTQQITAVLFLDVDNFKVINDSVGHHVGDHVLITLAHRLQSCVRAEDTVARLGGDEFTILFEGITEVGDVVSATQRIQSCLHTPFTVDGHEMVLTTSIGIACATSEQDHPASLMRDADLAMYRAKTDGKAGYVVFDRSMSVRAQERFQLETELRRALSMEEFEVHYQPIIQLDTGEIIGVEALVRWNHPQRGMVAPVQFIPVAEETGLIVPLGLWVLRTACQQAVRWHSPTATPIQISVNLSAAQVKYGNLVKDVAQVLADTGLEPARLQLEITESVLMTQEGASLAILQQLKELGVQLAIDDFGTGYSSLAYLKRFPIDILKIDRSFVDGLGWDSEDTAIVNAITMLARTLHLEGTGEGIETAEQWRQLRALGCERGQGYLFARPMPAQEIDAMIAAAPPWTAVATMHT